MSRCVLDTSALAAVLFWEPGAEQVVARLEGAEILAPTLLPYEIANVAVNKLRAGEDAEATVFGLGLFHAMAIQLLPVDPDHAAALAEETDLTAYDSAYLWLALAHRAELVTLDQVLDAAWRQAREPGGPE